MPADAPPHRRGQLPTLKPGQLLLRGTANLCLLCVLCFLLLDPFRYPPVLRAFLYGLGLYALLSFIMDGPGAAVSHWLGIPVTPHFDAPWLSTSIASFWNRRLDLSF